MSKTKPYRIVVKSRKKNGWVLDHTTGSHEIYVKEGFPACPVKCNKKDKPSSTLMSIERITGLKF